MMHVILASNSFTNITNFRGRLVEALVEVGYAVTLAAPKPDLAWSQARGVNAVEIRVDRSGLNPVTDGLLWLQYLRLMRRIRPNFLLGFTAKPNIYGSLAANFSSAISLPNVSGLGTAFMRHGMLSRFVSMLYRLAFRASPIVFFQNSDDRDLFVARKIVRSGQARVLPGSGVDLEHFAPTPMIAGYHEPRFLFIGRLLGDKGVRELVEAIRLIRREHPGWRFQLLGDIDVHNRSSIAPSELQQWIEEGLVEHLGHAEDVRPFIAQASAVVLPSYREGLSRSLLEAAAMARPMIATDVPGNRQLVEHGVNGFLCEVRNPGSLADAFQRFGNMGRERQVQMGQAARELVEQNYGVDRVVRAYLDALAQLSDGARV